MGAVGKHHARWKDRISNKSIDFCQISAAARLRRADSTKLVQNHPIFMHFGPISGLQSGLGRGETGGLGIWRNPGLEPIFISAVFDQVAHRITNNNPSNSLNRTIHYNTLRKQYNTLRKQYKTA